MTVGPTLYRTEATDVDGSLALRVTAEPGDQTGFMAEFEEGGRVRVIGLSLDRKDLQQLRHAITLRLVELAPVVKRP